WIWQFSPSCTYANGPVLHLGRNVPDLVAVAALVHPAPLTIRFGVAAGPWNTELEAAAGVSANGKDGAAIVLSPPVESLGNTTTTATHNLPHDRDVRLIALDTTGTE